MQTVKHLENSAGLALETCPEAVQVMPPESDGRRLPLAVTVAIDTLFAALLLAGLLALPAWISTILT